MADRRAAEGKHLAVVRGEFAGEGLGGERLERGSTGGDRRAGGKEAG